MKYDNSLLPLYNVTSTSHPAASKQSSDLNCLPRTRSFFLFPKQLTLLARQVLKVLLVIFCYFLIIVTNLYLSTRGEFFKSKQSDTYNAEATDAIEQDRIR